MHILDQVFLRKNVDYIMKNLTSAQSFPPFGEVFPPRGELVDFYDGGDHVRPFSQTPNMLTKFFKDPKYVD